MQTLTCDDPPRAEPTYSWKQGDFLERLGPGDKWIMIGPITLTLVGWAKTQCETFPGGYRISRPEVVYIVSTNR